MFKDIISRDNGCPWGSTGLTSKLWLHIPIHNVKIADLIATQPGIYFHGLREDTDPKYRTDPYPHVVLWNNEMYLEDGHHRVFRALLDGEATVDVRLFTVLS